MCYAAPRGKDAQYISKYRMYILNLLSIRKSVHEMNTLSYFAEQAVPLPWMVDLMRAIHMLVLVTYCQHRRIPKQVASSSFCKVYHSQKIGYRNLLTISRRTMGNKTPKVSGFLNWRDHFQRCNIFLFCESFGL